MTGAATARRRLALLAALLAAGALAAVPAPTGGQERQREGVRDLWREFPLDGERSPGGSSAAPDPAPAPRPAPQGSRRDGEGSDVLASLAVVIALVLGGGAVIRAFLRRRPRGRGLHGHPRGVR